MLEGRGGSSFNMLMEMPEIQDGEALVRVGFYEDLLCTVPEKVIWAYRRLPG